MPFEVNVVIIGDEHVFAKLHHAKTIIAEEMYAAAVDSAGWLESSAKAFVPKRTGLLEKSISGEVFIHPGRMEVALTVGQNAPYGPWVEYGTGNFGSNHRPYPARAIGNYPSQRVPPRVSRVETLYLHPGMRPHPYIRTAAATRREQIENRWEQSGHRISARLTA